MLQNSHVTAPLSAVSPTATIKVINLKDSPVCFPTGYASTSQLVDNRNLPLIPPSCLLVLPSTEKGASDNTATCSSKGGLTHNTGIVPHVLSLKPLKVPLRRNVPSTLVRAILLRRSTCYLSGDYYKFASFVSTLHNYSITQEVLA